MAEEVFFFPMSFAQRRLWFLDQLDPGSATYNIPGAMRLRGRLDISALKRSLNETIRRHEALRTSFNTFDGEPVQVITPALELDLTIRSLEDVSPAEREELARQLVTKEAQRSFDLKQAPLLRATLLRLEEQDHIFLLTMHHIISDGWSVGVMLGELNILYAAYLNGQPSPLPELPIQYADYAVWQRGWLQGEVLEKQLTYWRDQLADLPVLRFPTDHSRPPVANDQGAYYPLNISKPLTDSLKALSQQAGVTLFMTLLAAFDALLYRYTGQVDIVVGTPIANRNRSETEGLIGFFANMLALRTDLSGNPRFLDLLDRTHEVMVDAYAHQDLPFERIVEELQPERMLGSSPLFQVIFLLLNTPLSNISWPGITLESWDLNWQSVKFDLEFHLSEVADGLTGNVGYNKELFEESTIASLTRHYQNLLEAIVAAPDSHIVDLPLLTGEEQRQLLDSSAIIGSISASYPTLQQSFAAQAARTPDLPAVIFQDQSQTFRQLDERSNQLAHHLQSLGVTSGAVVGLLLERSLDLVVALLATLKTGAAVMLLESSASPSRWAQLLAQSPVQLLLTTRHLSKQLSSVANNLPGLVSLDTAEVSLAAESTEPLPDVATLESNAYLMAFTEGGNSRFIAITGQSVQRRLHTLQEMFELHEGEVVLHKTSFESDTWVWEILWPLCFGGCVVVAPPAVDHLATLHLLGTHGVNVTHAVASELNAWVVASEQLTQRGKLRWVLSSGEAVSPSVLERWQRLSDGKVAQLYGVPEAGAEVLVSIAANNSPVLACAEVPRELSESTSIEGRAVTSVALLVLDQAGQLVPVGVSGEICVGGPVVAGTHLTNQRIEESPEGDGRPRLVSNPFHEIAGAHLLRTGDAGRRLKDGCLRVEGQPGKAAWIDGQRVVYADVEKALLEHGSIEECAVRPRRTARGTQLVAYVVQNSAITNEQLQQWLAERLPTFLVPQVYVEMKALPMTASEELDETALSEMTVVDEQQLRELEECLRGVEEIIDVALIEQETEAEELLLHVLDVVAQPEAETVEQPNSNAEKVKDNSVPAETNTEPETKAVARPAISDGGPLLMEDGLPRTLSQMLRQAAQDSTHGVTYISGRDSTHQTYRELLRDATRIRSWLTAAGGRPGDHVILQLDDNAQFLNVFWGCVLGGMVPVPLSTAVSYQQESSASRTLENVWELLEGPLVVTAGSRVAEIRELLASHDRAGIRVIGIEEVSELAEVEEGEDAVVSEEQVALVLFTSGSTGKPKGVMLTHHNLISRSKATAQLNGFTGADVSLNWMPLTHVGGIVFFHLRDVYLGSEQVHLATAEILAEPLRWLDLMDEYGVTVTWAPNFAYALLNEALERSNGERQWDLSRLSFIFNGGEAVNAQTGRKFLRLLAAHGLSPSALRPAYGMSETSSAITYSNSFTPESTTDNDKFVSVGVPLPGITLRIVDEKGRIIEEETTGYLQVKGKTITSGYYKNPELNAEVFSDGWFNTGDLAFISQGNLTITGRDKDVIIVNGVNYYTHEIESVIEELDGVITSYTATCPIRNPGSNTDGMAVFFCSEFSDLNSQIKQINEIKQKVREKVGISPDYVLPVATSEIPKTSIGKIQRTQLRQRFEEGHFAGLVKQLDLAFGGTNTLPDWFYRQVWRPKRARHLATQLAPATFLIFLDEAGLGAQLSTQLAQLGSTCITVAAGSEFHQESSLDYRLDPGNQVHYEQLFKALAASDLLPQQVLHLWAYDVPEQTDLDSLMAAQQRGFYSVLWLAQELAKAASVDTPSSSAMRLLVITAEAQSSRSGSLRAYHHATLPGLLKSIRLEFPWLQCCHLDLEQDAPEPNAGRVVMELRLERNEAEVSYRDGVRLAARLQKIEMSKERQQPLALRRGGLYLMTGGLGGIGSYLARHLIQHYGVKLLLIGRTPLAECVQRLHAIDGPDTDACMYMATDVCDLEGLRRAVREAADRWGKPLAGVFHLAGEENLAQHWQKLDEHWIVAQRPEQVLTALRAKVEGTWTLYELLREHEGASFIGFSSVNSVFGAVTFATYAAANSFLDGYVQYQQARGVVPSWCFDWTMWDEVGMSASGPASMRESARALGFRVIGTEQGVHSLLAGLSLPPARLLVGLDGSKGQVRRVMETATPSSRKLVAYFTSQTDDLPVSRLRDLVVAKNGTAQRLACEFIQVKEMPRTESGEIDRRELAVLFRQKGRFDPNRDEPRTDLEKQLATIWKQLLGIKQLGIHDSFFQLGGHSLLAIQLISQVNKTFKVELTLAKLFEAPTIASLAELLIDLEAEPGQVDAVLRLRNQLNEMSADEIKAALRARQQVGI
jgi:acyl-CoA synthetase (AMP-forming)/AMP-acid ligase II/NADP-dependent 3-hydroxy acid dehydrogenase YdfG/acyl carrier protein